MNTSFERHRLENNKHLGCSYDVFDRTEFHDLRGQPAQ